eukprot:GHVR01144724.1.p1 GENE.GHVR01144724.1~~GHVR01144724.1.p1  ORF type:complete len:321 (-),score=4.98 GHVR01144724.1:393-1355(-)
MNFNQDNTYPSYAVQECMNGMYQPNINSPLPHGLAYGTGNANIDISKSFLSFQLMPTLLNRVSQPAVDLVSSVEFTINQPCIYQTSDTMSVGARQFSDGSSPVVSQFNDQIEDYSRELRKLLQECKDAVGNLQEDLQVNRLFSEEAETRIAHHAAEIRKLQEYRSQNPRDQSTCHHNNTTPQSNFSFAQSSFTPLGIKVDARNMVSKCTPVDPLISVLESFVQEYPFLGIDIVRLGTHIYTVDGIEVYMDLDSRNRPCVVLAQTLIPLLAFARIVQHFAGAPMTTNMVDAGNLKGNNGTTSKERSVELSSKKKKKIRSKK